MNTLTVIDWLVNLVFEVFVIFLVFYEILNSVLKIHDKSSTHNGKDIEFGIKPAF